jgi:hypothetical protein
MMQFLRAEITPYPDNVTQLTLLCVGWAAIGDMPGWAQAKFDIEVKKTSRLSLASGLQRSLGARAYRLF